MFRTSALALLPLGLPIEGASGNHQVLSYVQHAEKVQPAFAWCEAQDRILAISQPEGALNMNRPVTLYNWPKNNVKGAKVENLQLSPASIGSNQATHRLLSRSNSVSGTIQISTQKQNGQRLSQINEFQLGGSKNNCRNVTNAAFFGASPEHTVIVWEGDCDWSGLVCTATLATRNYAGRADLLLRDGQVGYRSIQKSGNKVGDFTITYSFESKQDGLFRVLEVTNNGSTLTTRRGSEVLGVERFFAYSVSLPQ